MVGRLSAGAFVLWGKWVWLCLRSGQMRHGELCSAGGDLAVDTRVPHQHLLESQNLDLGFGDPASFVQSRRTGWIRCYIINEWWFPCPSFSVACEKFLIFFSLAPCSELAGLHFWSLTKSCLKIFLVWSPQTHFFCSRVGSLGCPLATGQTRRKPDLVRVSWLWFWLQEPGSVTPQFQSHQKGQ